MLTPEQLKAREGKLTASRVGVLMNGSERDLYDLWRELLGDPDYQPANLDNIWPVALGSLTESLNLDWYQRKRGRDVTRRGEVAVHPEYPWAAATLDGWDSEDKCPIETKHVGGHEPLTTILVRYAPQFHWQMKVTGTRFLYASIIEGANEPIVERITLNHGFGEELWRRAEHMMECVASMKPPIKMPAVEAPVEPVVTYDKTGDNFWADRAQTWLTNVGAVKLAKTSEADLKLMVPADAIRVHGHGVEVRRDRAGRLSLRATETRPC